MGSVLGQNTEPGEKRLWSMMIGSEIDDVVFVRMLGELGQAKDRPRGFFRKLRG